MVDAAALVAREHHEAPRARGGQIPPTLREREREAPGERDRVVEAGARHLLPQAREILAGHRGRADEVEARGAVGLAVLRERRDDVVDRLLREDLAHGEDGRALVLQAARDLSIRWDV